MRYRLKADLTEVIERSNILEEEEETHYFFGLNDIFSFEEDGSVFSLVERQNEVILIHDFSRLNDLERCRNKIEKEKAIEFLRKAGYEPFMRMDINRYFLEEDGEDFIVEDVEQLGVFTDRRDLGGRKAFYGDLLKDEMLDDYEKEDEVRRKAQDILEHAHN